MYKCKQNKNEKFCFCFVQKRFCVNVALITLPDKKNDASQVPLSKKNYSLRYEPSKMLFPCYFLLVGVAKHDVIEGRNADNSIPLYGEMIVYFHAK